MSAQRFDSMNWERGVVLGKSSDVFFVLGENREDLILGSRATSYDNQPVVVGACIEYTKRAVFEPVKLSKYAIVSYRQCAPFVETICNNTNGQRASIICDILDVTLDHETSSGCIQLRTKYADIVVDDNGICTGRSIPEILEMQAVCTQLVKLDGNSKKKCWFLQRLREKRSNAKYDSNPTTQYYEDDSNRYRSEADERRSRDDYYSDNYGRDERWDDRRNYEEESSRMNQSEYRESDDRYGYREDGDSYEYRGDGGRYENRNSDKFQYREPDDRQNYREDDVNYRQDYREPDNRNGWNYPEKDCYREDSYDDYQYGAVDRSQASKDRGSHTNYSYGDYQSGGVNRYDDVDPRDRFDVRGDRRTSTSESELNSRNYRLEEKPATMSTREETKQNVTNISATSSTSAATMKLEKKIAYMERMGMSVSNDLREKLRLAKSKDREKESLEESSVTVSELSSERGGNKDDDELQSYKRIIVGMREMLRSESVRNAMKYYDPHLAKELFDSLELK